jgi:hypothetical protein
MFGERPPQREEFDEDSVFELPASMVRRGLAAMPSAAPPPPKVPPPGISDQDVVDLVGHGIIASWRECVQRDPLGTERGGRVGLADLTKDLMAWNSCQRTSCSDFVYRKACALLSIGDPDDAVATKKCCVFLCMYRARAEHLDKYLKAANDVRHFVATGLQPGDADMPGVYVMDGDEPVSGTFPSPLRFVNFHSPNVMWRSCFSAMTCIVRALDETLLDGIDSPVLRMWRDARSEADMANLYAEFKWGVPKSRQRTPAWLPMVVTCALGTERQRVIHSLVANMQSSALARCVQQTVYISPEAAAADLERLKQTYTDEYHERFVLSMNGFMSVTGAHVRLLTATVLWDNLTMFQHLLTCPDVDVNARTIVSGGGMTEFPPLLAIPVILAAKQNAFIMLRMLLKRQDLDIGATDERGNTVLHALVHALVRLEAHQIAMHWRLFFYAIVEVKLKGAPLLARERRSHRTAREALMHSDGLPSLMNIRVTGPGDYRTAAHVLEAALTLD